MMTDESAGAGIGDHQCFNIRWCKYDRRQAGCGVLLGLVLLLSACAALPVGKLVPGPEAVRVLADFHEMQHRQRQCPAGIDAEVTATFYDLLSSAAINGYLLTFPPAYLRFEGVNPLGLTENIFTINGRRYSYLLIRRQVAYTGFLAGSKVGEYITPRQAASISSWLLGRLPANIQITAAVRRNNDGGYWLKLAAGDVAGAAGREGAARILFSPGRSSGGRSEPARLLAYVMEAGGVHGRLALAYHYPKITEKNVTNCPIPDLVTVRLGGHKVMTLAIRDPYPLVRLPKKQFKLRIPPNFKRINFP
ncbi:MAG: hypothetical protein GXP59_06460 [Deltaproteobacteria bacterium]|nr:hypothetical protein [Deltaproteobacteria bacterium]